MTAEELMNWTYFHVAKSCESENEILHLNIIAFRNSEIDILVVNSDDDDNNNNDKNNRKQLILSVFSYPY